MKDKDEACQASHGIHGVKLFYVLKLELGFTSVANKSVVQSGMRANFSVLALTYMNTLL